MQGQVCDSGSMCEGWTDWVIAAGHGFQEEVAQTESVAVGLKRWGQQVGL